ncbi:MAG: hypothetical protein DSY55_03905 [Clostridia bacterium]|nr:MAG: hypothetical protein DSY55_03905 [Clostridia bacterium]
MYILVEVTGEETARIGKLYRELLNSIQEVYYASQNDVVAALTEALQEAHLLVCRYNQTYQTDYRGGATCLAVTSREIISAQTGPTILAVRSQKGLQWFSPLNNDDYVALGEGDAPSVEIGRVSGHPGIVIVSMNSAWANYLEVALMQEATDVARARAVADQMAGIGIDADEELSALVVTLTSAAPKGKRIPISSDALPEKAAVARPSDSIPVASPVGWSDMDVRDRDRMDWEAVYEAPEKAREKGRPLADLRKRFAKPVFSKTESKPSARKKAAKPKRLPYILGIIFFLIIAVAAITGGMWYNQTQQRTRQFEESLSSAQEQMDQAHKTTDVNQARSYMQFAQQQLDQASTFYPDDPRIVKLRADILAYQSEINKVVGMMAGFDLPLISFSDPASNPTAVFVNGLSVYILDAGRGVFERYQLDDATSDRLASTGENPTVLLKTGDKVESRVVGQLAYAIWASTEGNRTATGPLVMDHSKQLFGINEGLGPVNIALADNPGLQFVSGMYPYGGNLYLLDSISSQIWRYRPTGSNYTADPEPYFPAGTMVNLKSAIDVGIDGDIWLLYPSGSMLRFRSGQQQAFALETVSPPLSQAVAVWVNRLEHPDGRIYVADAATNRVVIFDKSGKMLVQLVPVEHPGALKELRDIFVDEMTNTLYLLTKTALYQAPLPTIKPGETASQ